MKIRCLANPNARGLRRSGIRFIEKLSRWLEGKVPITLTHSLEETRASAEQCLREGTDVVMLASGDGGIHHFITSFLNTYRDLRAGGEQGLKLPIFVPLKLGTANVISRSFGLAWRPRKMVDRLVSRLREAATRSELPVIRKSPLRIFDGKNERYGFLFGNGGIFQFFREYYRDRGYGIPRFLRIFGTFVVSLFIGSGYFRRFMKPVSLSLSLESKAVALREYAAVLASSIEAKVVFLRAFRGADRFGKLCVYAGNPGRFTLLGLLPRFLVGLHPSGRNVISGMVDEMRLKCREEMGYVIDGELYFARDLQISMGPVLEFLKP